MPPKPRPNLAEILQSEIPPDTGSPDPLSFDALSSDGEADSDSSPPPRPLTGRRIRAPRPGESDEEWSPPTNRQASVGQILSQSPDEAEEDSPSALPAHRQSIVGAGAGGKLDFAAASWDSDTEEAAAPAAMPHADSLPKIPRTPSPDVQNLFGVFPAPSPPESQDDIRALIPPLRVPPPPRAWHSADGVGAALLPIRDDPSFPPELQDAETTLASQIASAMSDPGDEGLASATFQTLLDAFLIPRLKGHDSNGHRVRIHQYSQFAARRGQSQSATARKLARHDSNLLAQRYRLDREDAERIDAVARRRVPDMTCMATFDEKVLSPDRLSYRLESHRGPKLSITEIKSFVWFGNSDALHQALSAAVLKAHRQNYVAAQFVFAEDERLNQLASFVGVGPVWLYAEWYRSQYPDLHGMPSPRNNAEFLRHTEREALMTPDGKTAGRRRARKRPRVDSPESEDELELEQHNWADYQPDSDPPVTTPTTRGGPNTRAVVREPVPSGSDAQLPEIGVRPWTLPDHIREIFTRRGPDERPKPGAPNKLRHIYVLDPDGRTYEAFDAIVERIREVYSESNEECPEEYRIVFDEDPYAAGSCPATVAKKNGEAGGA
ncbi:hypothetical protein GSI_09723 [Ganoderma sinense ZZ0214-1]|uniref:Uncharacterized protein n=1 Tax=Ganoderma sinense ZZ0214-1 TaxID=1077348 RepID=A0A2G8S337_9APHY|nr:hypothetical protein GSI_09723 [Ganoderma sinense ZZ0214-1]